MGDKWTLLIIRDLAAGPRRFVELQRVLPGISTEQLRSRLNRMVADGLLTRQRYREVPPRVDYELTERSRELMPVLGALARWGYDWTWSAPRPGEDVNVGAIFRLAPGMLEPPPGLEGSVDLIVEGEGEAPERRYRLTRRRRPRRDQRARPRRDGAGAIGHRQPVTPWVRALGPDGASDELSFTGNRGARRRPARRLHARRAPPAAPPSRDLPAAASAEVVRRPRRAGSRPACGPGT